MKWLQREPTWKSRTEIKLNQVIILQYIHRSNHYFIPKTNTTFYADYISIKLEKAKIELNLWFTQEIVLCLIVQWCLTLCGSMDCSPPGSSVHRDSLGKNTGVGCHALLQGIFPTQGSNPGLMHFRQILYQLSYQGNLCKRLNIQFKGKGLRKVKGKGESLRESCIPDQPAFTEG